MAPYELTFDIIFDDKGLYTWIKSSSFLNTCALAKLYHIKENDILASLFWNQAMAYKATIIRPTVSGAFGDSDTPGSLQYAQLLPCFAFLG